MATGAEQYCGRSMVMVMGLLTFPGGCQDSAAQKPPQLQGT